MKGVINYFALTISTLLHKTYPKLNSFKVYGF